MTESGASAVEGQGGGVCGGVKRVCGCVRGSVQCVRGGVTVSLKLRRHVLQDDH